MTVELLLERMIHGGRTIAHLPDGQVALVTGGLPGETVKAHLESKKGVWQGQVLAVLAASPDRVDAPEHPGLDYGFISYARQLVLKQEVVTDALSRALRTAVSVPAVRAAPRVWGYRSAVQPVVTREGLGYRKVGSHEVVTLARDPVANDAINTVWHTWQSLTPPKGVRELVLRGNDRGEVLASFIATTSPKNLLPFAHTLLAAGVTGVSYARHDARGRFRQGSERLAGERSILQRYGRVELSVSATNFAQPNPSAASELYEALVALAPAGEVALDLYAGSGVIGMYVLDKFKQVVALDLDKGSVTRGRQDAERLGLTGISFIHADAKKVEIPPAAKLICVDPPRAGLNKEVRELITSSAASSLLYVSCDVATWARDVAAFTASGWTLDSFEPFDFYPHTHHIELLSRFSR